MIRVWSCGAEASGRVCGAAGCGGSGAHSGSTTARPPSNPPSALATFNCTQWLAAPRSLRAAVLRQLHGFYGGAVSGQRRTRGYGTVLSDATLSVKKISSGAVPTNGSAIWRL